MKEIAEKSICSGCHSCYNICPKHCISMEPDKEGFLYPVIDQSQCIDCGMCKSVCPVLKAYKANSKGQAYACINKNENIRLNSSSGGIFTLIAEFVIDKGGVVFGAAFDDNLSVIHIETDNKLDLHKLRGSKYVQSTIGGAYTAAEKYLKQGRMVLFTGTPCQIDGLKSYLKTDYENLVMQDIVCHGVPSPAVWNMYLKSLSGRLHTPADCHASVKFRDKHLGWQHYNITFDFDGHTYSEPHSKNTYIKAFLANVCLRPSCYNCHSKSLERQSDITLADFWGVENIAPDMFDDKGTSLVFVNSAKGREIFNAASENMKYKAVDIDTAASYNTSAFRPCSLPVKRREFMENINADDFDKCVNKYTKVPLHLSAARKAKTIIKKLCGR